MYGAIWRQLLQDLDAHALGEGALVQVGVSVVLDTVVAAVGLALEVRVWWERTGVDLLSAGAANSMADLGARLEVGELGPVNPLDAGLVEHVTGAGGDVACAAGQRD